LLSDQHLSDAPSASDLRINAPLISLQ